MKETAIALLLGICVVLSATCIILYGNNRKLKQENHSYWCQKQSCLIQHYGWHEGYVLGHRIAIPPKPKVVHR